MDKKVLIEAINEKGLANSLITIYYNIGRALPFTAQRFPDGRCSEWYKKQYVEVHEVKPSGKGGKYGDAFGFYYRNGVREDSSDIPECLWCKKDDTEPQKIPNSACGSWNLIDILGEPTTEPTKVYGINDVLDKGKYKGKTVAEVVRLDWSWIVWANDETQHFHFNVDELLAEREKPETALNPDEKITFGKYKNYTIQEIANIDIYYLIWLVENKGLLINFSALNTEKIKVTMNPDDKMTFGKYKDYTIQEIANEDIEYLKWIQENTHIKINLKALKSDTNTEREQTTTSLTDSKETW